MIYSELDIERFEVRKVEFYADGSVGYTTKTTNCNNAYLGVGAFPPVEDYNALNAEVEELEAYRITKNEFLEIWRKYTPSYL